MSKNINTPPKYCPNAIASKLGWTDPSTGELLVSNKSLDLDLISITNNVIRTPLNPSVEENNDVMIAKMFPEDVSVDDGVSADVETGVKTELDETIVADVIEKAITINKLHEEASNSKILFNAEPVEPLIENVIDFEVMSKAELITYAKETFSEILSKRDNKTTLIGKIKELDGSK